MSVRMVMPEGVHALTIKEVSLGQTRNRYPMFRIRLERNDGVEVWWYVANAPSAEWVWQVLTPDFADIPELKGRTFLFPIEHEMFFGNLLVRVKQPIAEVLD